MKARSMQRRLLARMQGDLLNMMWGSDHTGSEQPVNESCSIHLVDTSLQKGFVPKFVTSKVERHQTIWRMKLEKVVEKMLMVKGAAPPIHQISSLSFS